MRRRVRNVMGNSPKISYRELTQERPKDLIQHYKCGEVGLQQQINKHCGDQSQAVQTKFYHEVYSKKE